MNIGDSLRGIAKKVDPSPSETVISITQIGKERSAMLLGKSQLGLILAHLTEFSPQNLNEVAHATEMDWRIVKRQIDAYPQYFEVRVR